MWSLSNDVMHLQALVERTRGSTTVCPAARSRGPGGSPGEPLAVVGVASHFYMIVQQPLACCGWYGSSPLGI